MRAVRRFRSTWTSGTLRSPEHDATPEEADHAERRRRGNPEGGYRRGHAYAAHGWLAQSPQGNHHARPSRPRDRGRRSPHASLADDFTVHRYFVTVRTAKARGRFESSHAARGNGLAQRIRPPYRRRRATQAARRW